MVAHQHPLLTTASCHDPAYPATPPDNQGQVVKQHEDSLPRINVSLPRIIVVGDCASSHCMVDSMQHLISCQALGRLSYNSLHVALLLPLTVCTTGHVADVQKMRAIKRSKTRDKREQAHREAVRAVQQADTKEGPRSVAGRIPGAFAGESIAKAHQVSGSHHAFVHVSILKILEILTMLRWKTYAF